MLLFVFCVLSIFENGLAVERFVIRREEFSVGDKFDIPEDFCRSITETPKCSRYRAIQRKSGALCECKCPHTRSSLIYNGLEWNCTDDLKMREQENCAVHAGFENPSKDQLVTRGESQVLMWNIRTKAARNTTCGLDTQLSRCLSCFNGWTSITDTERIKVFVDSSSAHLRILPPKSETLNGRIIKVVFNSGCAVSTIGAPCLLFKLQGQVNCAHAKRQPPSLSTLSSAAVQPTSPVVQFTPPLESTISSSVTVMSITQNPAAIFVVTSTSITTVSDVHPTSTKDNEGKSSNTNTSTLLHLERRRFENGNMLLFIGLCVAPLFILLVIMIFALTCYRYRAIRRGSAIIQTEPREAYENFILANPLYAPDNVTEKNVYQKITGGVDPS